MIALLLVAAQSDRLPPSAAMPPPGTGEASVIAHVDGRLSPCGTDHFDLIRDAGGWKILNIPRSQRTVGCVPQP